MGINFDLLILPVPKMDDYIVWCGQWYSMMMGYITCFSQGGQKHNPPFPRHPSPPLASAGGGKYRFKGSDICSDVLE